MSKSSDPAAPPPTTPPPAPPGAVNQVNESHYLIGPQRGVRALAAHIVPPTGQQFRQSLQEQLNEGEHVRTIKSGSGLSPMSAVKGEATDHVVAKLTPERVEELRAALPDHVIIEQQVHFNPRPAGPGRVAAQPAPADDQPAPAPVSNPVSADGTEAQTEQPQTPGGTPIAPQFARGGFAAVSAPALTTYQFVVRGEGNVPLAGVPITLYDQRGTGLQATTDANGMAQVQVRQMGDAPFRGFYAKPANSYWDVWLPAPPLAADRPNEVRLRSLTETQPSFPGGFRTGWGQQAMGLAPLADANAGRGVRIAIIDSGIDNSHPLLAHVQAGVDLTPPESSQGWMDDEMGHGTHVAGIIGARPTDTVPFHGFAPAAEIHAIKIFPGGTSDVLLEALDQCLAMNVDIVNMSLGSDIGSALVEQKLEELSSAGIACIVAAGNSGTAVQFPARSPFVLAVSAIGNIGSVAKDSWDEAQIQPEPQYRAVDGTFSPRFTCTGPQVGVAAPGVGIISTMPGGTFGPDTGTSMAAPHVTGLAALLLSSHPLFQPNVLRKNATRVKVLFGMIGALAVRYSFGAEREGAGVASLPRGIAGGGA